MLTLNGESLFTTYLQLKLILTLIDLLVTKVKLSASHVYVPSSAAVTLSRDNGTSSELGPSTTTPSFIHFTVAAGYPFSPLHKHEKLLLSFTKKELGQLMVTIGLSEI